VSVRYSLQGLELVNNGTGFIRPIIQVMHTVLVMIRFIHILHTVPNSCKEMTDKDQFYLY
jgi:hypothetical protein